MRAFVFKTAGSSFAYLLPSVRFQKHVPEEDVMKKRSICRDYWYFILPAVFIKRRVLRAA